MNRAVFVIRLVAALAVAHPLAGCATGPPSWLNPFSAGSPHEAAQSPSISPTGKRYEGDTMIRLAFDIARVDLPCLNGCDSRKVWNHVDELRMDTETLSRLARNGLRVGVATPDSWPAIETIMEATQASISRNRVRTQHNTPVLIALGSVADGETFFHYDSRKRLVGRTMAGGEKTMTIDYAFHPDMGGATEVRLLFDVRRDKGSMRWEQRGGVIQQVPDVDRYLYNELEVGVTLRPGESLLIGPGENAENEYLVGARFFRWVSDGKPYELLLIITPQATGIPMEPETRRPFMPTNAK